MKRIQSLFLSTSVLSLIGAYAETNGAVEAYPSTFSLFSEEHDKIIADNDKKNFAAEIEKKNEDSKNVTEKSSESLAVPTPERRLNPKLPAENSPPSPVMRLANDGSSELPVVQTSNEEPQGTSILPVKLAPSSDKLIVQALTDEKLQEKFLEEDEFEEFEDDDSLAYEEDEESEDLAAAEEELADDQLIVAAEEEFEEYEELEDDDLLVAEDEFEESDDLLAVEEEEFEESDDLAAQEELEDDEFEVLVDNELDLSDEDLVSLDQEVSSIVAAVQQATEQAAVAQVEIEQMQKTAEASQEIAAIENPLEFEEEADLATVEELEDSFLVAKETPINEEEFSKPALAVSAEPAFEDEETSSNSIMVAEVPKESEAALATAKIIDMSTAPKAAAPRQKEAATEQQIAYAPKPAALEDKIAQRPEVALAQEKKITTALPGSVQIDFKQVYSGSPFIYSILIILSIGAFGIWLFNTLLIRQTAKTSDTFINNLRNKLLSNQYEDALNLCAGHDGILSKMLTLGILSRNQGTPIMLDIMKAEGRRMTVSFWQRIALLNDIAIIAPMLGLLGTVLGMFYAFYDLNRSMESVSSLFDGLGISVGTTVAGLIVAILALLLHSVSKYRLVRLLSKVENEAHTFASLIENKIPRSNDK